MKESRCSGIFLFAILALLVSPVFAFAGPQITFDSEVHQFDEVESGTKIPAEFTFRNDGDEELIISEIKVTCDCTEAYADPERLKPGESGLVHVVLDTSHRVGALDKEAIVLSSDPDRPKITLHIKGKTWLPLTFKPSPLFFTYLTPGKEPEADVTLMNTGKKPITVKAILASEKDVSFEISGKGDAPVALPVKLDVNDYIWVRIKLSTEGAQGKSINRQISVSADPAPITPLILKIQANF